MEIKDFVLKRPVNKGWSGDQKYCAATADGTKYLLRISPIAQYERKKRQYDLMRQVAARDVPMCTPLAFGTCDEGVYSVQSWIDGADAEEFLPGRTAEEQYSYGFAAGRILREIHRIPAPDGTENWETYYNRKLNRKIERYRECPIQYENGQAFIDYIDAHRHLLKDRPCTYQHGDYHRGNMMIGGDQKLYIIDFDRSDFGDPWEDMKAITWDVQISPSFASGRINGYFDNQVPIAFWELFALYISAGILSSMPWAIPYGDEQIELFKIQAEDVLGWYGGSGINDPIPTWYQGVPDGTA